MADIVPLELEGAILPLYKVAVWHLVTQRGRIVKVQSMQGRHAH